MLMGSEFAKEIKVNAIEHIRHQIYHSPQTPGYTCWDSATVTSLVVQ